MTSEEMIKQALDKGVQLRVKCFQLAPVLALCAEKMTEALQKGKKILLCGNGGSAADAQHIAAELVGRFQRERQGLPAIALTANTSTITAIGNDFGYQVVFERQVEAFCQPGDTLVAISTSGKSENVFRAVKRARELGAVTIALTGVAPNDLEKASDLAICVPSSDTQRVQEMHITIGHILCELVEVGFCERSRRKLQHESGN